MRGVRGFKLRILLIEIDDNDCEATLLRLHAACVANQFTAFVAFDKNEAARYLDLLKNYEKKSSEDIEEKVNGDRSGRIKDVLTCVRSINKNDVKTLMRNFKSVSAIVKADVQDMALCAGIGDKKIVRLQAAFNEPFFTSGGAAAGAAAADATAAGAAIGGNGTAATSSKAAATDTKKSATTTTSSTFPHVEFSSSQTRVIELLDDDEDYNRVPAGPNLDDDDDDDGGLDFYG